MPVSAPVGFVDVLAAGGVGVVLGERAVADDEQLDVVEQPGPGPEASRAGSGRSG